MGREEFVTDIENTQQFQQENFLGGVELKRKVILKVILET